MRCTGPTSPCATSLMRQTCMYHLGPNVVLGLEALQIAEATQSGETQIRITMTWQSVIFFSANCSYFCSHRRLPLGLVSGQVSLIDSPTIRG